MMTNYLKERRGAKDCKYPVIPGSPGISSSDSLLFYSFKHHARDGNDDRELSQNKEDPIQGHAKTNGSGASRNCALPSTILHLF